MKKEIDIHIYPKGWQGQ